MRWHESFARAAMLTCIGAANAQHSGFELLSAEEAIAWNKQGPAPKEVFKPRDIGQPGMPNCHAIPASSAGSRKPQIEILTPTLGKPLAAPLNIDLRFLAAGAAIRPETFKVCYVGFVVMDITQRVTDHVAVSADGLHVVGADLPRGHHHLVMMIADQQGGIGSRDAVFEIK